MDDDDRLLAAADKTFRAAAIQVLTDNVEEYSIRNTYDLDPATIPVNVTDLLDDMMDPMPPATFLKPIMDTESGKILDFEEVLRNVEEMGGASTSMSLNRVPCVGVTSIKGSSSNVPFFPGGFDESLDNILSFARSKEQDGRGAESDYLDFIDLLVCPPGFSEDIIFTPPPGFVPLVEENKEPEIDLENADIFALMDFLGGGEPIMIPEMEVKDTTTDENSQENTEIKEEDDGTGDDLKEALAVPISASKTKTLDLTKPRDKFAYATMLNTDQNIPEYTDIFPKMAKKYPFPLDPFQQASVVCMEKGESVFVAAHTSAGKTVVAEYAIALCQQHKTRAIYTSPIKALSNQKFRDFKMIFQDVGLVTGDIQLHPEAFCIIMTTEILRSMLYNGSEMIRELEWVVFDEVHYINDPERGHVWEEVLIMLPSHVKIIMLSATVPNCVEFADWVGRIKNRRINVVSTYRRPVPLEHYLYTGQDGKTRKDLFLIYDQYGQFDKIGYNKAVEAKANLRKPTTGAKGKQFGGNSKNDKNVYINLVELLRQQEQLPMVCFVFSRKRCDENAQMLLSLDLTTNVEKSHVRTFFKQCIERLKGSDKVLPQVMFLKELCERGIGVHHSGILPILKEVVELLFQKGYVKILFATETFAMGVNMPARTVVFDSLQKHDGTQLRMLTPGEYIQMAGRAGRRGLDSTGKVIVLAKGPHIMDTAELSSVMMGKAAPLESKFRVTYSMLLNLLRVEQLRIEDMLQRSYVESVSLREGIARKEELEKSRSVLSAIIPSDCTTCHPLTGVDALRQYYNALDEYLHLRSYLFPKVCVTTTLDKHMDSGRVLVVTSVAHRLHAQLCLLVKETVNEGVKSLQLFVCCDEKDATPQQEDRLKEEFTKYKDHEREWLQRRALIESSSQFGLEGCQPSIVTGKRGFRLIDGVPLERVVAVTRHSIRIDTAQIINQNLIRMRRGRAVPGPLAPEVSKLIVDLDNLALKYSKNQTFYLPGVDIQVSSVDLFSLVSQSVGLRERLCDPTAFAAIHCIQFREHLSALLNRVAMEEAVTRLEHSLSSDALLLSEEYQNRLQMLKALSYVDESNMVSFKGRVACEIHHQELLITELILEGKLHNRSAAEVAALLSATTCQYKDPNECTFEIVPKLAEMKADVLQVAGFIKKTAHERRIKLVEVGDDVRFDLMEVVYMWAQGETFSSIMDKTDCQEGLIVRCIQRLGEVCKDVRNAARIVGDPALHEKMEQVSASIKRDIVFAASLYTSL